MRRIEELGIDKRYKVSLGGDKNILKLSIVKLHNFMNILKIIELYNLHG